MVYWIIYDITKNKNRKKIADLCKDYGFERVQKSAFLGSLTKNKVEMLALQAKRFLDLKTDKLYIVPAGKEEFDKKIVLGEFDVSAIQKSEVIFVG